MAGRTPQLKPFSKARVRGEKQATWESLKAYCLPIRGCALRHFYTGEKYTNNFRKRRFVSNRSEAESQRREFDGSFAVWIQSVAGVVLQYVRQSLQTRDSLHA